MPVNSFNREAYERFIREQNMSVEEFESNVRKQLLLLKLQNLALEGVVVTPQDVKDEFHRRNEQLPTDFSVTKLMAGIVQVLALGVLLLSYFFAQPTTVQNLLLLALTLQTLTIALLIMGRQQ